MKIHPAIFVFGLFSLAGIAPSAPPPSMQPVVGRTIYHSDDSRTESVRDPIAREMTEMTYSATGALTVKKVFLLNEKGEPIQGNVYDGRGNLVARCQSFYDEFGRRKEDRLTNLKGETFQQVIHEYSKEGKALPPKVINLNSAQAPMIKPAAVDYTQPGTNPPPAPGTGNSGRFAPVMVPEGGAPGQSTATAPVQPKAEEKPKTNFFKKLFKKDP